MNELELMCEQSSKPVCKEKKKNKLQNNMKDLKSAKQCFTMFMCIDPGNKTIKYTWQWQILSSREWLSLGREEG